MTCAFDCVAKFTLAFMLFFSRGNACEREKFALCDSKIKISFSLLILKYDWNILITIEIVIDEK